MPPRSLELFFIDGLPSGIMPPRSSLSEVMQANMETAAATHCFKLHAELLANGTLAVQDGHAVFQNDYAFSSPSAAGAVINGRSTNGRTAWRHAASNQTFAEWETARLTQEAPA